MKKLLKISTLALVMLSLFTVSCEKTEVAAPATDEVKTTWTPENSSGPITTKGDIKDGEVGKDYTIEPKLANPPCANGTWSFKVEAPPNQQFSCAYFNIHTGKLIFHPISRGTYKFIFTYKCPDGSEVSISISITVK